MRSQISAGGASAIISLTTPINPASLAAINVGAIVGEAAAIVGKAGAVCEVGIGADALLDAFVAATVVMTGSADAATGWGAITLAGNAMGAAVGAMT